MINFEENIFFLYYKNQFVKNNLFLKEEKDFILNLRVIFHSFN